MLKMIGFVFLLVGMSLVLEGFDLTTTQSWGITLTVWGACGYVIGAVYDYIDKRQRTR